MSESGKMNNLCMQSGEPDCFPTPISVTLPFLQTSVSWKFYTALSNLLSSSIPLYHHSLSLSKKITLLSISQKLPCRNSSTSQPSFLPQISPFSPVRVDEFPFFIIWPLPIPASLPPFHSSINYLSLYFSKLPFSKVVPSSSLPFYKIPFLIHTFLSNYLSIFLSHYLHFLTYSSLHSLYIWLLLPELHSISAVSL